jgi:hypothetical protein
LIKAARRSPLDFTRAVVVSNRPHFLDAAASLGCRTILVRNGEAEGTESLKALWANDLLGAVALVLQDRVETTPVMTSELQPVS